MKEQTAQWDPRQEQADSSCLPQAQALETQSRQTMVPEALYTTSKTSVYTIKQKNNH